MKNSTDDILVEFHKAAETHDLPYLLIGGFAASYWGTPRFTADVDYVVPHEAFEAAKLTMSALGYRMAALHPEESFAHFSPPGDSSFRIDLMLVDQSTWEKLKNHASLADFGLSSNIPIVGALHLVAMKLHSAKQVDRSDKYKDLNDIVEICIAQDISLEDLENSGILSSHGTEKIIDELRVLLESRKR